MDAEPIALLFETTLASSAALLLVLALRRPLRALLGAGAAYGLWLCVPVALLAVLLPRGADMPLALPVAWQMAPTVVVAAMPEPQAGWDWREWLLPLWLAGACVSAVVLGWQQRRFRRGLGALHRREDGLYQSASATAGLPAVAGLLRPRILLPADFERRYTEQERVLVIAHERLHVSRGDLVANALAALLCCLLWFNPLLWTALRRFRLDQELACDARVIARHPRARRTYGEAMLKTQFDEVPLPLGCHWQARHPIKERIDMLKRPTPTPVRWMAATLFALGLSASAGYVAWAAQPASLPAVASAARGGLFLLARQSSHDGIDGQGVLNQWVKAGEPAVSIVDSDKGQWKNTAVVEAGAQPGTFVVRMRLEHGDPGTVVAEPVLVVREGETAAIEQRDASDGTSYRSQFVVLPLAGSREETEARMRRLLAGEAADSGAALLPFSSRLPPPVYPVDAARQGIGGSVMLLVTVRADGSVADVQVEKSTPQGVFDTAAMEAARQWRFQPGIRDGKPVEGQVRVPITFETDPPDPQPSPVALSEFAEYQWMHVPKDGVAEAVCDVVRVDEASDKRVLCGIRKATVAR